MAGFAALQLIFDAVLLFAILFLFHYTVSRAQRKREDEDLLKSLEVEEIKQDLQELLMTLKQVGAEVSEDIQDKVKEAEAKTKRLRELLKTAEEDLAHVSRLSEDVSSEKNHLDEKWSLMRAAQPHPEPTEDEDFSGDSEDRDSMELPRAEARQKEKSGKSLAFSSDAVKEIYRLADDEMDLGEIVRRTKLTRGEVQLILNLRGNRFTTPN